MTPNTGNLSLYLGIGFIAAALVGLVIAYRLIKGSMETARVEKIIELGKWFIASVALVVGATIIADGFKEREQDIKEFAVFDKYVSTIMEADGGEKRLQLAEYFSIVSPNGELRDSWERYLGVVKKRRVEYLEIKQKEKELEEVKNRTAEQEKTLVEYKAIRQKYEEPLKPVTQVPIQQAPIQQSPNTTVDAKELAIIFSTDTKFPEAKFELNNALKINKQAKIYKKGDLYLTVIPNITSRTEADSQVVRAKSEFKREAYIILLQGWCKSIESGAEFSICVE